MVLKVDSLELWFGYHKNYKSNGDFLFINSRFFQYKIINLTNFIELSINFLGMLCHI
jgi:hypothetical protein